MGTPSPLPSRTRLLRTQDHSSLCTLTLSEQEPSLPYNLHWCVAGCLVHPGTSLSPVTATCGRPTNQLTGEQSVGIYTGVLCGRKAECSLRDPFLGWRVTDMQSVLNLAPTYVYAPTHIYPQCKYMYTYILVGVDIDIRTERQYTPGLM